MTINILDLYTRQNRVIDFGDFVGVALPCRSGNNILALSKQHIFLVDKATGDKRLVATATDDTTNRFNDASCDRRGRVWSGTITIVEGVPGTFLRDKGLMFTFDGVSAKCHDLQLSISNGISWSMDWTKMYLVDSIPQCVYSFDFDEESGNISNKKVAVCFSTNGYRSPLPAGEAIDLKARHDYVIPDGICIDNEGMMWIAEHNGGCVSRWNPTTGKLLRQVPIPARKVTACCFGGPRYDTLYVTTGSVYNSDEDWKLHPHSGGIFAVTNLGVKGILPEYFDDSKFVL